MVFLHEYFAHKLHTLFLKATQTTILLTRYMSLFTSTFRPRMQRLLASYPHDCRPCNASKISLSPLSLHACHDRFFVCIHLLTYIDSAVAPYKQSVLPALLGPSEPHRIRHCHARVYLARLTGLPAIKTLLNSSSPHPHLPGQASVHHRPDAMSHLPFSVPRCVSGELSRLCAAAQSGAGADLGARCPSAPALSCPRPA